MTDFAARRSLPWALRRDGAAPAAGSRTRADAPRRRFYAAASALCGLLLAVGNVQAQSAGTPAGTSIRNVAVASVERAPGVIETVASNEVAIVTVPARTRASIQWLRATADGPGTPSPVGPAQCRAATGALVDLPPPQLIGGHTLDVATPARVAEERIFHGGEPVFVRVIDADQDLDPARRDTVEVRVMASATGDAENARLVETAPSSGEFVGYVPTRVAAAAGGDCVLDVARASAIETRYVDVTDPRDVATAQALVNPQGAVFDSRTGRPLSGVRVRLVDAATGAPAVVLGDDGRSAFPSELTTGAAATDDGGTLYQFPPGTFRFPLVARPGSYRLLLETPAGYAFPSQARADELQALPGAPFLLTEGSFGGAYAVASPAAVTVDVPLDPIGGPLVLGLATTATDAAIGDAVPYTATLSNVGAAAARDARLELQLPPGFRYAEGSARLRVGGLERAVVPQFEGAAALRIAVGDLPAGASATLTYVARIGAGAGRGTAVHDGVARADRLASNAAQARVLVRDDLFRSRGFVLGRLVVGECGSADGEGVANVRVYLQDGRYAVTDAGGRFHFEDLAPGTHALHLDAPTLPEALEPVTCEGGATQASASTRLVDLRAGGLARADFRLRPRAGSAAPADVPSAMERAAIAANGAETRSAVATASAAAPVDKPALTLLEKLPSVDTLVPGREWLLPSAAFSPPIPAVHVAVKHDPRELVELTVNGSPVPGALRDTTLFDTARTLAVSRWRGVALSEGDNRLVAEIRRADGTAPVRLERVVAYGGAAVRAELDAANSRLVADGRTRPVVVLKLYDRFGRPARPGLQGNWSVEPPHRAWSEVEALRANPLTAVQPRQPQFTIDGEGRVHLELEPTSQAGAAVLRLQLAADDTREIRTWLAPAARDWVLVGLAEGTGAWRTVSANAESLPGGAPSEGFDADGRVAFFAKGRIRGDYLLTLAYDSARDRASERERVGGTIDPQAYYTLYGDATESRHDAPSQRKLYVKLERREFVALFGDFATGFTVTELARYSRTLNGVRVEGDVGPLRAAAFASRSAQVLGRDVLPADGSSGPFRLRSRGLLLGSDVVRVEVRDRFRSEVVVATRTLQRHLDYDLDERDGTLMLRRPLPSRDEALNPTYLVVEYELPGDGREYTTAGLRATHATADGRLESGTTLVYEDGAIERRLAALDARARLATGLELRAEAAQSEARDALDRLDGAAWLVEATHVDAGREAKVYAREQGAGFGLGQQAATEGGTRKLGAEGRVQLTDRWSVRSQAYEQRALDRDATRRLLEGAVELQTGSRAATVGLRTARDDVAGQSLRSDQAYASATHDVYDGRVVLKASAEAALGGRDASLDFPDRTRVGADYRLTPDYTLVAAYERASSGRVRADLWSLGVKAEPWAGGQLQSALNASAGEHGSRLYSSLGVTQGWRVGERWSFDFGAERADTLRGAVAPLLGAVEGPSGGAEARAAALAGGSGTNLAAVGGGGLAPATPTDFTSGFAGIGYRGTDWSVTSRYERRTGRDETRSLATLGAYREVGQGRAFSLAARWTDGVGSYGASTATDLRLSAAWRPDGARWLLLDRLDLVRERSGTTLSTRFVNNLHASVSLDARTQVGLQLGLRHATQRFDGDPYRSRARLLGFDARRDLDARWDVGVQATRLDTPDARTSEQSYGIDVGRRVGRQLWVSVGWNFAGFGDRDFERDRHTAHGPFVRFRVHVDQDGLRELVERWRPGQRP